LPNERSDGRFADLNFFVDAMHHFFFFSDMIILPFCIYWSQLARPPK
jgi:hypothetical protein